MWYKKNSNKGVCQALQTGYVSYLCYAIFRDCWKKFQIKRKDYPLKITSNPSLDNLTERLKTVLGVLMTKSNKLFSWLSSNSLISNKFLRILPRSGIFKRQFLSIYTWTWQWLQVEIKDETWVIFIEKVCLFIIFVVVEWVVNWQTKEEHRKSRISITIGVKISILRWLWTVLFV